MLVNEETKNSSQERSADARPSWDNSGKPGDTSSTSTKLFLCAVLHGGVMIGIGWIIVRFLMRH